MFLKTLFAVTILISLAITFSEHHGFFHRILRNNLRRAESEYEIHNPGRINTTSDENPKNQDQTLKHLLEDNEPTWEERELSEVTDILRGEMDVHSSPTHFDGELGAYFGEVFANNYLGFCTEILPLMRIVHRQKREKIGALREIVRQRDA